MTKKLLVVEPWLGEFGWLLMRWQGHIRWLSKRYDKTVVHHADNLFDRAVFFEYADNLKVGREYHGKVDRWSGEDFSQCNIIIPPDYLEYNHGGIIYPCEEVCKNPNLEQDFQSYRYYRRNIKNLDDIILIHARDVKQKQFGPDRNWPREKWERLVRQIRKEFPDIAVTSIGSKRDSMSIEGTVDLQDIELRNIMSVIANSKMLIGPSSGPHHLAALCETPSVVWTGVEKWDLGAKIGTNMERYETEWNPFGTPCSIIQTWQPSVDEVFRAVAKRLENEN